MTNLTGGLAAWKEQMAAPRQRAPQQRYSALALIAGRFNGCQLASPTTLLCVKTSLIRRKNSLIIFSGNFRTKH
jgi:hypothetical protein